MPNFFTDNEDILEFFNVMDIRQLLALRENQYTEAEHFDFAPVDYEDAVDSYRRVLEVVGGLAGDFIEPLAAEVDEEGVHLQDGKVTYARGTQAALEQLARADLMGFTLPRRYGGLNMPVLIYSMAIEMVSRADASLMNIFGLQDIAETINRFASEEMKQKYLPRFCSGEVTGAMVLTEPDAGSDLTNVQLRATHDEAANVWRLNGVKRFITNGCGDVLLVLARSEPQAEGARGLSLFVCESDGTVHVRRIEDKLGIHGSPTCEIEFHNTSAELVGERKRGLSRYVLSLMNGARLAIAAQGIGIAQAALSEALDYAAERVQFKESIRRFPAVRQMLGNMHMKVEAARLLTYHTAIAVDVADNIERLKESGELASLPNGQELKQQARFYRRLCSALTPVAKYYATEMCNQVCYDAIQVLGGSGYMRDYNVERHYRDARITTIYEGTTQIQHNAAVGSVTTGFFEQRFEELHQELADADAAMLAALKQAREHLRKAVEYANDQDEAFRQLNAGRLVESATNIYNGYLLVQAASQSEHKQVLAANYIADELQLVKLRCEQVLRGDRTYLDRMSSLLKYE